MYVLNSINYGGVGEVMGNQFHRRRRFKNEKKRLS